MGWKSLVEETPKLDTDLLSTFLNSTITSTIQTEYYSKPEDQMKAIFNIHKRMLKEQREAYALSLLLPINHIHKQLIIFNLLKHGKGVIKEQKEWENKIIRLALRYLPTNRAYKVFTILQLNKVNNKRTRELAKEFLLSRKSLEFEAIKYKKSMKNIIIHNHINAEKLFADINQFLFKKKPKIKTMALLKTYIAAKKDKKEVYKLPYSVALGFKELHKIPDKTFYNKIKEKMTHGEKLRTQEVATKHGVKIDIDFKRYDPIKMLKYFRANVSRAEYESFAKSCERMANKIPFRFSKIRVILDRSRSMYGSYEKKFHPISVSESIAQVLSHLSNDFKIYPEVRPFMVKLEGETDLSVLLKALKDEPELLVILSDGYENAPAGLAHQILHAYLTKIDKKKTIIIHINPVFAPEMEEIRTLHKKILTMGIRNINQLALILLIGLAHYRKTKEIEKVLEGLRKKIEIPKKKKKKKKGEK